MDDLTKRLRKYAEITPNYALAKAFDKAADAITQLEAENARLREALTEIAAGIVEKKYQGFDWASKRAKAALDRDGE